MRVVKRNRDNGPFRSVDAARWSVFFDRMGIKWIYEPDEYVLPGVGIYRPAFFVKMRGGKHPGAGYWVDILSEPVNGETRGKMAALMLATRHHGYIFSGPPTCADVWSGDFVTGDVRRFILDHDFKDRYMSLMRAAAIWCCAGVEVTHESVSKAAGDAVMTRFVHQIMWRQA